MTTEDIKILLQIMSPILSFAALFIGIYNWRRNLLATRNIQHYNIVTQADNMFALNEACLRFHDIDSDTIEGEFGVTSAELSYLLLLFNSGSISNKLSNDGDKEPFDKGSYFYNILMNKPTQKAFPLLQKLFDSKNPFMTRCQKTIDSI